MFHRLMAACLSSLIGVYLGNCSLRHSDSGTSFEYWHVFSYIWSFKYALKRDVQCEFFKNNCRGVDETDGYKLFNFDSWKNLNSIW